jgi:hypothetical protein
MAVEANLASALLPFFCALLFRSAVVVSGSVVSRGIVIRPGAIVIVGRESDNPFHFSFQSGLNHFRLTFTTSHAADIRRVKAQLTCDAAVKSTE